LRVTPMTSGGSGYAAAHLGKTFSGDHTSFTSIVSASMSMDLVYPKHSHTSAFTSSSGIWDSTIRNSTSSPMGSSPGAPDQGSAPNADSSGGASSACSPAAARRERSLARRARGRDDEPRDEPRASPARPRVARGGRGEAAELAEATRVATYEAIVVCGDGVARVVVRPPFLSGTDGSRCPGAVSSLRASPSAQPSARKC